MNDVSFRNVMGKFATGVTVILVNTKDGYHGMTANAFMSVSLDPALICVSVDHNASMLEKLKREKQFSVNILLEDQIDLARHFAKQQQKSTKIEIEEMNAVPILKNALASISCRLYDVFKAGDHTLFLGEVDMLQEQEGDPLIFYHGEYSNVKMKFARQK